MRAAVAWKAGEPFVVEPDVVRRPVGPFEVVVRIRAAGVCQTDIALSRGAFGQSLPVVLGHEGAGEIIEVGQNVATAAKGDRVVLTWVPPCGRCYFCIRGETYICSSRRRSGDLRTGDGQPDLSVNGHRVQAGMGTATFAQEAIVPAGAVIPIPDDLPYEYAALLGCAVPTGVGAAINAGNVQPGDTVVVTGCGAVGLSALQGALIAGATTVVAVDPQESRRRAAAEFGASATFVPGDPAFANLTGGIGFDVGIDAVGNSATIRGTWDAVRRGGTVVVVGAGKADDQMSFTALELFHDQKSLRGCFYGSANMVLEIPRLIALWRAGRLNLAGMIDDVVGLDRINEAVQRQTSGEALRVMLSP